MSALINPTSIVRFNIVSSCFSNVWIPTMYIFDNAQFTLRQSTSFSCNMDCSYLQASVNRKNTRDVFNLVSILESWQLASWKKSFQQS